MYRLCFGRNHQMRAEAYSRLPIRELRKRGLISRKARNSGGVISELLSVLGLESLDRIPQAAPMCLRASNAWTPSERGIAAWFLLARKDAAAQEVGVFSRERLLESLSSLFQASVNVEKIPEVPAWLAENGIAFVYLPHFEKTYLDGATFRQEGKPVLGLTLRHDRLDNFGSHLPMNSATSPSVTTRNSSTQPKGRKENGS